MFRPLEVALVCHAEVRLHHGAVLSPEHAVDLDGRPHEEFALLTLAVGVLRGVEASERVGHLAQHVVDGLLRDAGVERVTGGLVCMYIQSAEESVVVQHLLEVRNEPEGVR